MMKRLMYGMVTSAALAFGSTLATAGVVGPFEVEAEGVSTQDGAVVDFEGDVTSQTPISLNFDTLTSSITLGAVGGGPIDFTGSFVLSGADGDLFADVTGVLFDAGGFSSTAGSFIVTGGTGIFDGLTGEGVVNSLTFNEDGSTQVKIAGTLVPAPGVLGLFAVSGLVCGRRRRRA